MQVADRQSVAGVAAKLALARPVDVGQAFASWPGASCAHAHTKALEESSAAKLAHTNLVALQLPRIAVRNDNASELVRASERALCAAHERAHALQ